MAAQQANFGSWSQTPRPSLRHHPETASWLAVQIAKAQEHVAAASDDELIPVAKRLAQAGGRLWSYRIQKRMSQSALGRATGVSQHVISVLEHGRYCPTPNVRARICEVLGAPENAIWGEDLWGKGRTEPGVRLDHKGARRAFGDSCREQRLDAEMTQKDVARLIGISPARLGQIERGEGPGADPDLAARIREVLGSVGRKTPQEQARLRIAS